MKKSLKTQKINLKRDFIIAIGVFVILLFPFAFIFDYLVITPNGLPIEYWHYFYIPVLLIIFSIFLIGLISALSFSMIVGTLSKVFNLNDFSYSEKRSKMHIIFILLAASVFLIILYIYFIFLSIYEPNKTLLLSWMVFIFIRCAHYTSPKLGHRLGSLIISFFIPFGLFLLAINILESSFFINFDFYQTSIFWLYFFIILSAQIPIEILIEYTFIKNKEVISKKIEKELKQNWKDDPAFTKY